MCVQTSRKLRKIRIYSYLQIAGNAKTKGENQANPHSCPRHILFSDGVKYKFIGFLKKEKKKIFKKKLEKGRNLHKLKKAENILLFILLLSLTLAYSPSNLLSSTFSTSHITLPLQHPSTHYKYISHNLQKPATIP